MFDLHSRVYFDSDQCKKLDSAIFFSLAKEATRISILSAYYSVDFLRSVFESMPSNARKKCSVNLVFNGFAGQRLVEQKDELRELNNYLLHELNFKKARIFLNVKSSLFHTKLFKFETGSKTVWFIGSANASSPAFEENEEILLRLDGHHDGFENYIEAVIRDSSEHAKIENPRINTLTKFWRTGLIYYKPNTQIQFTFNSLDLPAWVIEELSKASERPKYTNPGEPWGAYNLKRSMGLAENKSKGKRINISAWSVETCFGYWVPSKYVGLVESRIDGASENKMADLMAFRDKLNQNSNDQLVARFREYLKDVDKIVGRVYKSFKWTKGDRIVIDFGDKEYYIGTVTSKRNGKIFVTFDDDSKDSFPIKSKAIAGKGVKKRKKSKILEQYLAKWVTHEFWRPSENLPEKFQDFVNRLRSRLHNDSQLERARKPLIPANMPEIWSDVVASEDFSTSFFEYVSYKLNSPGSRPLIVKSLDSQVDFVKSASAKDVRDKFEEFLKNNNWEDDYWLEK